MNCIVAVDNNWAIGMDQQLLYNLPTDMNFFKSTTMDKVVIMGDATLNSLPNGQPLKNRINLVLSNNKKLKVKGGFVFDNINTLLAYLKNFNTDNIYVIGGASVYKQLLPYCKYAYVTKINGNKEANKFFPNLDKLINWNLVNQSPIIKENGFEFNFVTYENNYIIDY